MRSNPFVFILIFSAIILIIDFYAYRGVRKLVVNYSPFIRRVIRYLFWIVPAVLILELILFAVFYSSIPPSDFLVYFHTISGTFILFYIPKLIFIIFNLLDDLVILFKRLIKKEGYTKQDTKSGGKPITRGQFLNRVGIVIAGIPFVSIAYGIKWGRFNYTLRENKLSFPNLPSDFEGFRIVQISDFHIGSFANNRDEVNEAIDFINEQKGDLLLFTGDFVNNVSTEIDGFMDILNRLETKYGKYSILGNHDYGEYIPWKTEEDKNNNLKRIIQLQEELGFKMLLNDSVKIGNKESFIELIGVENWGLPPFPQYGDIKKAMTNVDPAAFKILLSHDPTHWDEQILNYTNIDLTLSGHTHGAQFGIEIPGWRWSPVDIRYKRWGGMYQEGSQYLNVNTGLGFIGFPGRVGMPPEVTVIELRKG